MSTSRYYAASLIPDYDDEGYPIDPITEARVFSTSEARDAWVAEDEPAHLARVAEAEAEQARVIRIHEDTDWMERGSWQMAYGEITVHRHRQACTEEEAYYWGGGTVIDCTGGAA